MILSPKSHPIVCNCQKNIIDLFFVNLIIIYLKNIDILLDWHISGKISMIYLVKVKTSQQPNLILEVYLVATVALIISAKFGQKQAQNN